jgi:hypothetical protein
VGLRVPSRTAPLLRAAARLPDLSARLHQFLEMEVAKYMTTMPAEEKVLVGLVRRKRISVRQCLKDCPPYFIAGVLVSVASVGGADRGPLLRVADRLYPGIGELGEYKRWLAVTPLRPSRFLPQVKRVLHGAVDRLPNDFDRRDVLEFIVSLAAKGA